MPRNREDIHRRLQQAALELFRERGFDQVTAAEIATQAGATERTFFRHFSDKREVLSAGSENLRAVLVEKIQQVPDVSNPLQIVVNALMDFDWESLGTRDIQRQRHAVIAANPSLLERDLIKHRSIAVDLSTALNRRGVALDVARLAAHVGVQLFALAYDRWLTSENEADLTTIKDYVIYHFSTLVNFSGLSATPR